MINEEEILLDIQEIIESFSKTIFETSKKINKIKEKSSKLNNNYFNEDNDRLLLRLYNFFNEIEMQEKGQTLFKLKTLNSKKIQKLCKHEWITDDIDYGGDKMQQICYCKLCEVSKKI